MRTTFASILITLVMVSSHIASAHQGSIRGVLSDATGNRRVAGAGIVIDSTRYSATADPNGNFFIKGVTPGKHYITVVHRAYETIRDTVTIEDGETTEVSFKMVPMAIEMKAVSISAMKDEKLSTILISDMKLKNVNSSQDLLRLVPGLFLAQHQGGGKAEQIFIRGFDCDHGTDVAISVDNMPVNMVSHAHGQGYADAHFIIPESVQQLDYGKGPYEADKGNFYTGGYVSFKTRTALSDNFVTTEGGMYDNFRSAAGLSLLGTKNGTPGQNDLYVMGEYVYNRSYFDVPQDYNRLNVLSKYTHNFSTDKKLSLTVSGFHSRWNASGQLPERAVAEGIVDLYGQLDDEGGNTSRYNANLEYANQVSDNSTFRANLYATKYDFLLYSNFTFFASDPVNGDQIRQAEDRMLYGYNAEYTNITYHSGMKFTTQVGTNARYDDIQNDELSHTAGKTTLLNRVAYGDIHELNLAGYAGEKIRWKKLTLNLGLRYDFLAQEYDNKLSADKGGSAESNGLLSPKAGISYQLTPALRTYYSFGSGFHSNDARTVQLGSQLNGKVSIDHIVPRAYGSDLGIELVSGPKFTIGAALWWLDLEQEFGYSGDAAVIDTSGRTRRYGMDVSARYHPWKFFSLYVDINYAHSGFIDLPEGENYIPLSPILTSTGGVLCNLTKSLSAKVGYRYMADRPADETRSLIARGYTVFDAAIIYGKNHFQYSAQVQNLFNVAWREAQFATETRLRNEVMNGVPAQTDICFTPGTPFFLKLTATYKF